MTRVLPTVLLVALTACGSSHSPDAPPTDPPPDASVPDARPGDDAGSATACPHRAICEEACEVFEGHSARCCHPGWGCSDERERMACIESCCEETAGVTSECARCAASFAGFDGGCNDFECACVITTADVTAPACNVACGMTPLMDGAPCTDDGQCSSGLCYGSASSDGSFGPKTCQALGACLGESDRSHYCDSDADCCAGTCCVGCGEREGLCLL